MPASPIIFVTRAIPAIGLDALAQLGELRVAPQDAGISRRVLEAGVADATALVSMLSDPIDDALLTPGVLSQATAEMALALILDVSRGLTRGEAALRSGGFSGWGPLYRLGRGLQGQTLGIVGMGSIGQELARMVQSLGPSVLYHQRHRLPADREAELRARFCPLDELLTQSDIVSLHCPLTPETTHLLDAERLGRMKPGSILINRSRGAVVDEAALVQALRQGPLAGAGLDVYENEPALDPGLLDLPNVVLAPHLGSATVQAREAMAWLVVQNVADVLAGSPPKTAVK